MKKIKFKTSETESPIIGLIETPAAILPNVNTAEKSSEPNPEGSEQTPVAGEGASNAGGSGSSGAERSKGPARSTSTFPVYASVNPGGVGKRTV